MTTLLYMIGIIIVALLIYPYLLEILSNWSRGKNKNTVSFSDLSLALREKARKEFASKMVDRKLREQGTGTVQKIQKAKQTEVLNKAQLRAISPVAEEEHELIEIEEQREDRSLDILPESMEEQAIEDLELPSIPPAILASDSYRQESSDIQERGDDQEMIAEQTAPQQGNISDYLEGVESVEELEELPIPSEADEQKDIRNSETMDDPHVYSLPSGPSLLLQEEQRGSCDRDMPAIEESSVGIVSQAPPSISCVFIQRILAPVVVEQGQQYQEVTVVIQNSGEIAVELISTRFHFRKEEQDVTSEYTVRSKVGNPEVIRPGACEEIGLTVDIAENATVGKITLIPVVLVAWENQVPQEIELKTTKLCQWQVEPVGRTFILTTTHQGIETAGIPFGIKIETYWRSLPDITYQGSHRIFFSLSHVASSSSAQVPSYMDLVFDRGIAITDQCFCFYNTVETYILRAKDNKPGGGSGESNPIQLNPSALAGFRLEITSPQKNDTPLEGENTLTAIDLYNNTKSDYHSDTVITSSEGRIRGIPGMGNTISGASFREGVVDLTSLRLRITIPGLTNEGKVVRLTAHAQNKSGYSNDITILPAVVMSPSASQALIRRLSGFRRKKIWIANTEPQITYELQESFKRDYEVNIQTIDLQRLDTLISNPPDILFLDAGDPSQEMYRDGYQIVQEIRNTPHMECLPIFILGSGRESESQISEVLRIGCIYLSKPLSIPALRAMVADLLQNISVEQGHMPARGARIHGSEGLVYQIVAKIGEGGMGYIYEAKRLRDQKKVIVKYLPPRDFKNVKSVVRFIQEAHTVLSFQHENLVAGYDMLMDRNRCFYVMEFIDGKTVEQLIRQEGKIKPERALRIVIQVARALQSLDEEHKLVHRDIKPANILVTEQGLVKLVDFGIAKLSNHHLTTVGIILGTPYYLSPEQILGKEINIQSDIYSLGATFYHMVTGQHPFQGPDVNSIIHQRLTRDARDPRDYNRDIPIALSKVIMRMLDRKPSKRYDSARALVMELEEILQYMEAGIMNLEH